MSLICREKRKLKGGSTASVLPIHCKVTRITHRNVLKDGFDFEESIKDSIDAVFLDLPSPEKAVQLADQVLKKFGYICSFSPCIEQIQKTIPALVELGYGDIKVIETTERDFSKRFVMETDLAGNQKERIFSF
jgi:tRNA A58 N-methylase Trm61